MKSHDVQRKRGKRVWEIVQRAAPTPFRGEGRRKKPRCNDDTAKVLQKKGRTGEKKIPPTKKNS